MTHEQLPDDDFDRLARHLAGESSPSERVETEQWIAADPARRAATEELAEAWRVAGGAHRVDVEMGWQRLSGRLASTPESAKLLQFRQRRSWWRDNARLVPLAAAALLVAGAAILWPVTRRSAHRSAADTGEMLTFNTATGQRRNVDLSDGTHVSLGVASELRVLAGYGKGAREVALTGEATFTVTHDRARPFRVHAGRAVIEDLGTEFAIRSYGSDAVVRVAVVSGSVSVRRGSSQTVGATLARADVAVVADTGEVSVARGQDVGPYLAFARGRLVFDRTPLTEVAAELQRWYGVDVRLRDASLGALHYTNTGGFENESLDEVLRVIAASLNLRYEQRGRLVEFTGTGGATGAMVPSHPAARLAEDGA
jgi:transmembrane sensor